MRFSYGLAFFLALVFCIGIADLLGARDASCPSFVSGVVR